MSTIRDVARLAGVSVATVSRVINKLGNVNPETADQVLKAIEQLQYEPNSVARGLAGKKTGTIALILPDISNPFFPALARAVEDVAHQEGLTVIFGNSDGLGLKERSYIKILKKKYVDGIIIASNTVNPEEIEHLRKDQVPIVLLDRGFDMPTCPIIRSQNREGAKLAVQHLLSRGCRKIAHIYGPQELITARERLLGYEDVVSRLDWYSPSLTVPGNFDIEGGRKAIKLLLERQPDIDGVFAGNDLMAIGALKGLRDEGIPVPEKIKVCGFDGISLAEITEPELTTVAQPIYEMGALAAKILIREINTGISENTIIKLDVALVPRKSTWKEGIDTHEA